MLLCLFDRVFGIDPILHQTIVFEFRQPSVTLLALTLWKATAFQACHFRCYLSILVTCIEFWISFSIQAMCKWANSVVSNALAPGLLSSYVGMPSGSWS